MVLTLPGCGSSSSKSEQESSTKTYDKTVAIHAGKSKVYLDEAKYYAYTAQGTYETYYLTKGKDLNWNKKTSKGVSMENLVKSTVLDDICRRECMYALRDEYAVTLSQEESDQIDIKLSNYYTETNGELLSKIGISKSRLKKVFEKKEIADKVENLMSFNDKKLPDEMYKKWKSDNTVTAEVQWENISFKHHIFTSDDLY